jgi:hypothetical protein
MAKNELFGVDNSSGFIQQVEGTVKEAYFGTLPNYENGNIALLFFELTDCTTDELDQDGEPMEVKHMETQEVGDYQLSFTIGKRFQILNGGARAEVPDKPGQLFQAASIMGIIVANVAGALDGFGKIDATFSSDNKEADFKLDGLMEAFASDTHPKDPDPRDASLWEGKRYNFREVHLDYGGDFESNRLLPVEYIKTKAKAKPAKKAAPKAEKALTKGQQAIADAKAKKAAASNTDGLAGMVEGASGSAGLTIAIQSLLDEADNHDDFVGAAIELDDIVASEELTALLADEDGGFWSFK